MPRPRPETPIATYPAGTPIPEIRHYDRSMKVAFTCGTHPGGPTWVSKDPRVSSWFPATSADDALRDCGCKSAAMVTTAEYLPTRNG